MELPTIKPKTRTCHVCGNQLPLYLKICDRCGSIQRPVSGDGKPLEPLPPGICQRCRKQIPEDRRYCQECEKLLRSSDERSRKAQFKRIKRIMKQKEAERKEGEKQVAFAVCVSCGRRIHRQSKICDYCGARQEPAEVRAEEASESVCARCGRTVPEGKTLCDACLDKMASRANRFRGFERRIRLLSNIFMAIALASLGLFIWSMFNLGSMGFVIIAVLAAVSFTVSLASQVVIVIKVKKHFRKMRDLEDQEYR